MVKILRSQLSSTKEDAVIAIKLDCEFAEILDRDMVGIEQDFLGHKILSKGGIIGDRSLLEGAYMFPVSMIKQEGLTSLPAGDWTVIPYVRDLNGNAVETNEGMSFDIEIVADGDRPCQCGSGEPWSSCSAQSSYCG